MKAHELARTLLEGPDFDVQMATRHVNHGTVAEIETDPAGALDHRAPKTGTVTLVAEYSS